MRLAASAMPVNEATVRLAEAAVWLDDSTVPETASAVRTIRLSALRGCAVARLLTTSTDNPYSSLIRQFGELESSLSF
jgi:hypothetical protein